MIINHKVVLFVYEYEFMHTYDIVILFVFTTTLPHLKIYNKVAMGNLMIT